MNAEEKARLEAQRYEYSELLTGYHSRDEVVSQTFHEMLQGFTFLLVLISSAKIVVNPKVLFVVYILLTIAGTIALLAFLLDLQGNASARRALRLRLCELEEQFESNGPKYWKSIRNRPKFFEESLAKPNFEMPVYERLVSSDFFIVAARFLLLFWLILSAALLIGEVFK